MKKANKKPFAIAFSDIQIEDWKRFSKNHSRLRDNYKIFRALKNEALKRGVDTFLFEGDFFDNPKELSNIVITKTFKYFKKYFTPFNFVAISGNHDQSTISTKDIEAQSHLELYDLAFQNFYLVDRKTYHDQKHKISIHGIPYLKDNVGLKSLLNLHRGNFKKGFKNILLLHADFSYINYDENRKAGRVENMPLEVKKFFKGFDLVLSGHIHKPQIIRSNVVMVGATHHQRISDAGVEMGYWIIYDDLSYEFKKLKAPKFIWGKAKDEFNFYLEKPIVENTQTDQIALTENFTELNPKKLAISYIKSTGDKKLKNKNTRKLLQSYLQKGLDHDS